MHGRQEHTYRLVWQPDLTGFRREMEFEGTCAQTAVRVAQRSSGGRVIRIYENGRLLGSLERMKAGFWIVSCPPRPPARG